MKVRRLNFDHDIYKFHWTDDKKSRERTLSLAEIPDHSSTISYLLNYQSLLDITIEYPSQYCANTTKKKKKKKKETKKKILAHFVEDFLVCLQQHKDRAKNILETAISSRD